MPSRKRPAGNSDGYGGYIVNTQSEKEVRLDIVSFTNPNIL